MGCAYGLGEVLASIPYSRFYFPDWHQFAAKSVLSPIEYLKNMNNCFSKQEKIRFRHVDNAGIVFYPRFLEMLNDLVEDWFEEAIGNSFALMHKTHGIPTVDLKVQFKNAARIGQTLTKKIGVLKLGTASVTCAFQFDHEDGSLCLSGEVTLVYVSLGGENAGIKSAPFSEEMKNRLSSFVVKSDSMH